MIDAGHGGVDPGKVGVTGVLEKEINLKISLLVEKRLKEKGFQVIMTRTSDKGLYLESSKRKKREDLNNRVDMINRSGAFLAVSIHQNSFTSSSVKGTQVFYYNNDKNGKTYAEKMQNVLREKLSSNDNRKEKGNSSYFMLKNAKIPLLIVECGFLSNQEEEKLLSDEAYQKKMAEGIVNGIEECMKIGKV